MSTIFENFLSGMNSTLLWENPNPNSDFASQNITLNDNFNQYDYLMVRFKHSKDVDSKVSDSIIKIDENYVFENRLCGSMSIIFSDNLRPSRVYALSFNEPKKMDIFSGFYNDGRLTNYCIPIEVYGIKGKVHGIKGGGNT